MNPANTKVFRFDTETYPIRPGLLAPKIVCLQYAFDIDGKQETDGTPTIVIEEDIPDVIEAAFDWADIFEAHNGAYDYAVLAAAYPALLPKIFKLLSEGRGRDTYLREQLTTIKEGHSQEHFPKGYYSLAGIAKRLCGLDIEKGEDTFRLKYALLDGVPVEQWPPEAVEYALGDITSLRAVSRAQNKRFQPKDEWFQVASAFVLQLCALWGLRTDPVQLQKSKEHFRKEAEDAQRHLINAGLLVDGTVKKAKVQDAVARASIASGIPAPRTKPTAKLPEGQIKTDAETCELFKDYDPVLSELSRHTSANKMLETYLNGFDIGIKHSMTSKPNAVVATGRTSWGGVKLNQTNPWWPDISPAKYEVIEERSGTNLQNFPKLPGIRECIVPREGFYLCSVDYSALELRTLAQVLLWWVGESKLAAGFNSDENYDPHSEFGGALIGVDYKTALHMLETDKSFKKGTRQLAKAANFSFPGGVGGRRLAEMFAVLYKEGKLPKPYTVAECYVIRDKYLQTYPEMGAYFEIAQHHATCGKPIEIPVSGMLRGGCNFTAAANTPFQAVGALCSKRALIAVSQACYVEPSSPLFGSRPLIMAHDEIIAELPIDRAHEAAYEISRLMCKAASEVCPDIPFAAPPALMTRWLKEAEPKFDEKGRLLPWDFANG